jgi:hypothetical protein
MLAIQDYLNLVTSEHNDKPKFMAFLQMIVDPLVSNANLIGDITSYFDIDTAIGAQLDIIGQWIGRSRYLDVPLTGVYFSLDIDGLGFDQGTWLGPYDPTSGLVALPDDSYRVLLKAKIAANQWDGTIPSAYAFMSQVFPGNIFFIIDNQDMSMYIGIIDNIPLNAVTYSLFTRGYLDIKPGGVRIAGYIMPSTSGSPIFGFDVGGEALAGLDVGSWAKYI